MTFHRELDSPYLNARHAVHFLKRRYLRLRRSTLEKTSRANTPKIMQRSLAQFSQAGGRRLRCTHRQKR